jgi:hypothetical protein
MNYQKLRNECQTVLNAINEADTERQTKIVTEQKLRDKIAEEFHRQLAELQKPVQPMETLQPDTSGYGGNRREFL